MGRGGGRSGGGFHSGGSRGFSSHRSSSSHRGGGSSFRSSVSHSSNNYSKPSLSRPVHRPSPTPVLRNTTIFTGPRVTHYNTPSHSDGSDSYAGGVPGIRNAQRKPKGGVPGWYKWLCGFMAVVILMMMAFSMSAMKEARDYRPREKLGAEACISTDNVLKDEIGWISDTRMVKEGIDYFYKKTGVQPYLLICDHLGGKGGEITDAQAEAYLEDLYDSLFKDEGHMIYVFMEYAESEYVTYLYTGVAADSVIDQEAREIFLNKADRYYTDSSLSDEEFFAKTFHTSADDIMKDYSNAASTARICLILSLIAAVGLVMGYICFKVAEEKRKETEELSEILQAPISELGNTPEENELIEKYSSQNQGGND